MVGCTSVESWCGSIRLWSLEANSRRSCVPGLGFSRVRRKLSDAVYRIQNAQAPRQRLVVHFVTSGPARLTFIFPLLPLRPP